MSVTSPVCYKNELFKRLFVAVAASVGQSFSLFYLLKSLISVLLEAMRKASLMPRCDVHTLN